MNLTLGISTSLSRFEAVLADGRAVLFNSIDRQPAVSESKDLALMLQSGLAELGFELAAIRQIVVDIGPGGTSSVRTGVSFANALGYALGGLPVRPVSSIELMGLEVWNKLDCPALVFLKSIKNQAYVGLFNGQNVLLKHGDPAVIVRSMAQGRSKLAVAGAPNFDAALMAPQTEFIDSGVRQCSMEFFLKNSPKVMEGALGFPRIAVPLTEQIVEAL